MIGWPRDATRLRKLAHVVSGEARRFTWPEAAYIDVKLFREAHDRATISVDNHRAE